MHNKKHRLVLTLSTLLLPAVGTAADHTDSPAALDEPAADITDLHAWMSDDASKLNLILSVSPFAGAESKFSDAVQYVFHVNSGTEYGGTQTETQIICQFDATQSIECWAGGEYAKGDANTDAGLSSESGKFKVFAGLRDDPFFMELNGFSAAVDAVINAAPNLDFDDQGCPAVDAGTSGVLVGLLQGSSSPEGAQNSVAGMNVLSIVVQVDKSIVSPGGPLLGVWSSTHSR